VNIEFDATQVRACFITAYIAYSLYSLYCLKSDVVRTDLILYCLRIQFCVY